MNAAYLLGTVCAFAVGFSSVASAQDMGRVLSSVPVVQQVSVPRQVCTMEQIAVQQPKSGAGAAMGAIAGGAIGNSVGQGAGRAAATVVGVIGGAVLGDRIEGAPATELRDVQRCGTQTLVENRTVGFSVVYEYAGKQYSVQMANDPGPTIPIQVSPVGATAQASPAPSSYAQPSYPQQPTYVPPVVYSTPAYLPPPPVVITQPMYPVYYARPYYPRPYYPAVNIQFGYRGHGHRGHHHWR
jgi:uncharacterized protein YcfJ